MNIAIFAAIGCQNLGDELILKNEIEALEKKYTKEGKKVSFKVFTYDIKHPFFTKSNLEYQEYFPIGIRQGKKKRNLKNYFHFLKTLFWADLVVIGGGGLFYDTEKQSSTKNLDLRLFRIRHFRALFKTFVFYGISIDIHNLQNNSKIHSIFSAADKVFVRDEYSRKFLYSMKIHSHEIDDPVMSDNPLYNHRKKSCIKILGSKTFNLDDLESVDVRGKRIGIAFRPGYLSGSGRMDIEVAKMWEMIHFLIGNGAKKIVFMPHSIHPTDTLANDYIFMKQFLSPKVDVLDTIQDTYIQYKQNRIDICFAMRLHSMILSQVYHIPFIAFSYSKKTDEFLKKIS